MQQIVEIIRSEGEGSPRVFLYFYSEIDLRYSRIQITSILDVGFKIDR